MLTALVSITKFSHPIATYPLAVPSQELKEIIRISATNGGTHKFPNGYTTGYSYLRVLCSQPSQFEIAKFAGLHPLKYLARVSTKSDSFQFISTATKITLTNHIVLWLQLTVHVRLVVQNNLYNTKL